MDLSQLAGHKSSIAVELAPIHPEHCDLNLLERQLLAKILTFVKIITLPEGRQGAVVCVPSEVETTVNTLPRSNSTSQLHGVKTSDLQRPPAVSQCQHEKYSGRSVKTH